MRYHCIGIMKRNNGEISGYTILDEITKEIRNMNDFETLELMGRERVANIRITDGKVAFYNGVIERYPCHNGVKKTHIAAVVIRKYVNNGKTVGFTLYDNSKGLIQLMEYDLIKYSKIMPLANAKVVQKGDKLYIASINGEFETEEVKSMEPKIDQELSAQEFISMLIQRGCTVSVRNSFLLVKGDMQELIFENLSIPDLGLGAHIMFDLVLKVKNITIRTSQTTVTGAIGSYVENLRLTSEAVLYGVKVTGIGVRRCITFGKLDTLDEVFIENEMKEFIAGDKLSVIKYSFHAKSIELIDLSKCKDGRVDYSFLDEGRVSKSPITVWVGGMRYFGNFLAHSNVKLMDFFTYMAVEIDGFGNIEGLKKLDLSRHPWLKSIKGMENCEFEEVLLPNHSIKVTVGANFMKNVRMKRIEIPNSSKCLYRLDNGAFDSVEEIVVGGEASIGVSRGNKEKVYVITSKTKETKLPSFTAKVPVNVRIEEGIERLNYSFVEDAYFKNLIFPKTLKEIVPSALEKSQIEHMNLEDTQLERVGKGAFKEVKWEREKTLVCPDTLKVIEDGAFNSMTIRKIYVPKSVKSAGRNFFVGDIMYTAKGGLIDKTKKGTYVKIYVDSVADVKELISEKRSSERDIAKVTMTLSNKEGYEWVNEDKYKVNARFIVGLSEELKRTDSIVRGIPLDESKFVDFELDKLGVLGRELNEFVSLAWQGTEDTSSEDTFNNLCNIITNNTEFYAGHFTSKVLERYGKTREEAKKFIEKYNTYSAYTTKGKMIVVMPLGVVKESQTIPEILAIVIIVGNKIKYTTLLHSNDNFFGYLEPYKVGMQRVEDYLVVGDALHRKGDGIITVGRVELPKIIANELREWEVFNLIEGNKVNTIRISPYSGRVYKTVDKAGSSFITAIVKPEKHKYQLGEVLNIDQTGCFRYFDIQNGIVHLEKRVMKSEKSELTDLANKLMKMRTPFIKNELVEFILDNIDKVKVKTPVKHFRAIKKEQMGDYICTPIKGAEGIKALGYSRNKGTVYRITKKTWRWNQSKLDDLVECYIIAYNMDELLENIYEMRTKPNLIEPQTGEAYSEDKLVTAFKGLSVFEENELSVGISRKDGTPYLLYHTEFRKQSIGIANDYINLGQLRNEIEALKEIQNGLTREVFRNVNFTVDMTGIELADRARRGEIPVGLHPEYTMNLGTKIYEMLGL